MISLDVKNVYTSIPKHVILDIIKKNLTNSNKWNTKEIHEIINAINVIINQNYFLHDNKIYSRKKSFVINGPLRSLLSGFNVQHYETSSILDNKISNQYIKVYLRYVYNTFI